MARNAKAPAIMVKGAELTKELIQDRLASNDSWLYRAIVAIYNCQTADEQSAETTAHDNGIGFNGSDAPLLSSFAKQVIARGFLTPKQKDFAIKKMRKYAGQLLRIAQSRSVIVQA